MKSFIFCTIVYVFACNGAADEKGLVDRILTVLPGKITGYQVGLVMPDKYKLGICLLADKNMKRYPQDLAYQAALQIITKPNFFRRPQPPAAITARVMKTADLMKFGPPAIALFLLFDRNSIITIPGYMGTDKTVYHSFFNNGCTRPEILILNAGEEKAEVTEISSQLLNRPEIQELWRRGETEAVEIKQREYLAKKDFDIAVQINHQAIKEHFCSGDNDCAIL